MKPFETKQFEQINPEPHKEELPDNVVIFERPEARYRIIYEMHGVPHSPEEFGSPDAMAMELITTKKGSYENKETAEKIVTDFWANELKRVPDNKKSEATAEVEYIKNHNIPLYLMDIIDLEGLFQRWGSLEMFLKPVEMTAATAAGVYGGKLIAKNLDREMSRRDFLKLAGTGAVGGYFGTHILETVLNQMDYSRKKHLNLSPARRIFRKIQEKIHPETERLLIILRNALWAQKLEAIAKHLMEEKHRRPEIAVKVGAYHIGLEDMLLEPAGKRSEIIKKFILKFATNQGQVAISPITRVEFSKKEGRWLATDSFREPALEEIEKSLPEKK